MQSWKPLKVHDSAFQSPQMLPEFSQIASVGGLDMLEM